MIEYTDYGLIPRISYPDNIPTEKQGLIQKFCNETADKFTRIGNREVDLLHPLSSNDWKHWFELVKIEKDSIGFC